MSTRFDTTPAAVRWSEAMHAMALSIWLAALAGAGLAAAIAFPSLKSLQPTLPGFPGMVPDHWMIAGGHVGRPAFMIADRASLLAAAVAVVTLAIVTRLGRVHGAWLAVRWVCVGGAASLAVFNGLFLAPRMDDHLVAYWEAAKAGDVERAARDRALFTADHPTASRILGISAMLVLGGIGTTAGSRTVAGRPAAVVRDASDEG